MAAAPNGREKYMKMALKLAERGADMVSPNPVVGAAIVREGRVVGRGWHRKYGGRHAEVNAILDAGKKAMGAELYVTLEPCNHYGKQPPCTKAILKAGVRRVFAAMEDPNPVSRHGAGFLRKHGVQVDIGMCGKGAEKLNEFYIINVRRKRPFITIKIAMTERGFITYGDGRRKAISGKADMAFVQKLRERHDAILVGLNTVLKDDPRLTVRGKPSLNPVRVVLDSEARTPTGARILREKGRTIIACTHGAPKKRTRKLKMAGAEIIFSGRGRGGVNLEALMRKLFTRGIRSVLVEPGNRTATSFLKAGLFDRIIIIVARRNIKEGLPAFTLKRKMKAHIVEKRKIGNDLMIALEK